jgi:small subunit ribosomal protein S20
MANIPSQIKRARTNEKSRARNAIIKSQVKTAQKKVIKAINDNDAELASKLLIEAIIKTDKAVSSKVLSKEAAARQKRNLQKQINQLLKTE